MGKVHKLPMAPKWSLGVSLFVLAIIQGPDVQAVEPIETKWKQSIEADLRNGDPAGDVSAKAKRRAPLSDDVDFKNWACEVARRTCPPGSIGGQGASPQHRAAPTKKPGTRSGAAESYVSGCPLLSAHDVRIIASGRRLRVSSGDCSMSFN